jgi:hypothetical protein
MRNIPVLILWAALLWSGVATAQQRVSGRVVDRDGSPQARCLIEFFPNPYQPQPPVYRVTANNEGYFYLPPGPRYGPYSVRVRLGQRQDQIDVTINQDGLNPPVITVSW